MRFKLKTTPVKGSESGVDRGLIIDKTAKKNDNSNGDATRLTTEPLQAKNKLTPPWWGEKKIVLRFHII